MSIHLYFHIMWQFCSGLLMLTVAPFTQRSCIIIAVVVCQPDTVFQPEMWRRVDRTGGRTDVSPCISAVFLSKWVAKDSHVALWDISLYLIEWRTCVDIRLSGRHALDTCSRLIRSHWFGSPILHLWYYLQRLISAGAKFHPSPPPRLSHRGGCGVLAQDPRMQMAAWMGLL